MSWPNRPCPVYSVITENILQKIKAENILQKIKAWSEMGEILCGYLPPQGLPSAHPLIPPSQIAKTAWGLGGLAGSALGRPWGGRYPHEISTISDRVSIFWRIFSVITE